MQAILQQIQAMITQSDRARVLSGGTPQAAICGMEGIRIPGFSTISV